MEQIRVLHVDDDTAVVDTTSKLLEKVAEDFVVETETEPQAVVDRLADEGFDCIVSDYQMPGMNGLELLDAIRETYADLPFILYTAQGSEAIASEAISRGVTDYLQKRTGIDHYEVLANRIETAVSSYRAKHHAEREREQRTTLFEHATDPILDVAITPDRSKVLAINDAFEETFGYEADEVRGRDAAELLVPEEGQDVHESLKRRLLTGESIEAEVQRETADGLRDFLARAIPYEGVDGKQRAYAWYIDITEQKRRERELEESRERYRSLFENNPLVIWEEDFSAGKRYLDELAESVDDLGAYLSGNPAEARRLIDKLEVVDINEHAVEYYGAPSKEVLLDNFEQIFTGEAIEEFVSAAVALARGQRHYRTETVTRTWDGDTNHELIDIYVPEAYADDLSRVYVTGMDISERKAQERELKRQNQRLDDFASVVSHDLRNPLRVADGKLELVQQEYDSEHLDAISRALDRMNTIIEDTLTMARQGETVTDPGTVELASAVDAAWSNVESGDDVTLTVETDCRVEADPDRLHQLLANLLQNAVEHGDTTIRVGRSDNGFYVADDGPGIPADDRDAVFDRGYSTSDSGTGFGLAIVETIAHAHGWTVTVTDSDDGGARFELAGVDITE